MGEARHSGRKRAWLGLGVCCLAGAAIAVSAQQPASVSVQVEVVRQSESSKSGAAKPGQSPDASGVAVWLIPVGAAPAAAPAKTAGRGAPQLLQRNKTFSPHVLIVQAGSMVQFPNEDPFFHNVFSLFAGKRFDLGLYEAGSSRSVRFDKPGASFLFCNIHPEMSAVIVVVPTPYYGISDVAGRVYIAGVPDGRYHLKVWHERSSPEELKSLEQIVAIGASSRSIGPIRISDNVNVTLTHKNKYGQDYPPALTNAAY
jgi:plastocyanin